MKFALKGYQTEAVEKLVASLSDAAHRFGEARRLTAVALSAPTGAGKTVIATALIERLLHGNGLIEPNRNLTVLWVTDDPSLNQQTARKMVMSSSELVPGQLVMVDATFDQETFDAGTVNFMHIQQLGKGAVNYVRKGDRRQFPVWDTIANTIRARGADFLLVVDEAHRGTRTRADGDKTITARLMAGAGGHLPPAPVVLGISATPTRFTEAIASTGERLLDPVGVDVEEVRRSGLIKDRILVRHPTEQQPSDATLLEMAVADLRASHDAWARYVAQEEANEVVPVLVIQVRPGVSDSEIGAYLDSISRTWPEIDPAAVAHSFQEHASLNVGSHRLRYVAPQDIQDDPTVRVVFFKEALTTGWDCPRAEVMVSLRRAVDHTYVAQLIGRMVRTPLARRVSTNEALNAVSLYLPFFEESEVRAVIEGMQKDDAGLVSEIEANPVVCPRNSSVPGDVWAKLEALPTYTRPSKPRRSEVARLSALALLLAESTPERQALETGALGRARDQLITSLDRERERLGDDLAQRVAEYQVLDYQTQSVDLVSGAVTTAKARTAVSSRNLHDLFKRAGRLLGDAAAKWYWDHLCDGGMDPDDAKVVVAVLGHDPVVRSNVEGSARDLITEWRGRHIEDINALTDSARSRFFDIWREASDPQQVLLRLPNQTVGSGDAQHYDNHLFEVEGRGYPSKLNAWEAEIVKSQLMQETLVTWYRNPTAGDAALGVPYSLSSEARTLYPDFLFVHRTGNGIAVDLIDPHRPNESDTSAKWLGLALYAKQHGAHFRRVLAAIRDEDSLLVGIDLTDTAVISGLEAAQNESDVRKLFRLYGKPLT